MPSPADGTLPPLLLAGGPPLAGNTSSVPQRMAQAWRAADGRVLYLELAGRERQTAKESDREIQVLRLAKVPGLPWSYPDAVRRLNLRRNLPRVRKALKDAGFQPGKFVALYYGWYWAEWLEALEAEWHVYDCIDEHRAYPHIAERPARVRYVWEHEQRMLARADLLLATSAELLKDRGPLARSSLLLPNGVGAAAWRACAEAPETFALPGDLAALPAPRVVLLGHLQPKLDFNAVEALAEARPELGIALIGPRERGTALPRERRNLRWLGAKPYAQMPTYLAHTQAGLLPLLPTAYNQASCPLKLLEYLAAGLPVAASAIPASMDLARQYPRGVHLAQHGATFADATRQACQAARELPRSAFAAMVAGMTWDARVRKLADALKTAGAS